MKRFIGLFAIASLAACTAPVAIDSATQGIINGVTDTNDAAVIMVVSQIPGMQTASLCTGEIISPHVVLTAAHCVDPATVGTGAKTIVFIGSMLPATARRHPISFWPSRRRTSTARSTRTIRRTATTSASSSSSTRRRSPRCRTTARRCRRRWSARRRGSSVRHHVGLGHQRRDGGHATGSADDAGQPRLALRRAADRTARHLRRRLGRPVIHEVRRRRAIVGVTSFGFQNCPLTPPAGTPPGFEAGNDTRIDTYADFIDMYVNMSDPPAKHRAIFGKATPTAFRCSACTAASARVSSRAVRTAPAAARPARPARPSTARTSASIRA